jgi:hypothetical protein
MLKVAERRNSPAALADALSCQGCTPSLTGHCRDALTALNRAMAVCPDGAGRISFNGLDPLVESLGYETQGNWAAGYPDRAINFAQYAIKRCGDLNQPYSMTTASFNEVQIRFWRGEVGETQHLCEQLEALAEERGFVSWLAMNRIYQGWVASTHGEHERAIGLIRSGIADWKNPLAFTLHSAILAEACLRAGRYKETMDAVATGREHVARTGEHHAESEVERVAGETLLKMGAENAAGAEQCLRHAIAIATEQGAKSFELRATTSLARLLRDTARRDEARTMLTPVYGWFTEGFETADLKDAKALLDELGA